VYTEPFSVVAEKFIRDLDPDRDKINVSGVANPRGHPRPETGRCLRSVPAFQTAVSSLDRDISRWRRDERLH